MIGAGVGDDMIKTKKTEWNLTVGPAYQHTVFGPVQAGENKTAGRAALVVGSRFDVDITSRIEFKRNYRGQLTSREAGDTTHHAEAVFEIEVWQDLVLDISFIWDRVSNPKPDSSGTSPQPDDFRLVFGMSWNF